LEISVESIRDLRLETGAGVMDCKRALQDSDGNFEQAVVLLRTQGMATAAKKASRTTNEGIVEAYIHPGNRVGAIVEINCETDFVGRTPEFRELAHNLAMQIAAMDPQYVTRFDGDDDHKSELSEDYLLEQAFIKDTSITIQDLINDMVARVGENVRVRRFSRFSLGED
jgi:elongation factor Ts